MVRLIQVILSSGILVAVLTIALFHHLHPGWPWRYAAYLVTGAVSVDGLTVHQNPADEIIRPATIQNGWWEPTETSLTLELLHEGETAIDVGANVGYYTMLYSREVGPSGRVYAFEPEPVNFGLMVRGIMANDLRNVIAEQLALSNAPGKISLYVSPDPGDHRIAPAADKRETIEIEAVSLDDYLSPGTPVHLVKIDTQGAEALIIEGMRRVIDDNHDIALVFEFWPEAIARTGRDAEALLHGLADRGFSEIFEIDEQSEIVLPVTIESLMCRYGMTGKQTNIAMPRGKTKIHPSGQKTR